MIVFDLKCGNGHVFEAWFGSSAAYEQQRAAGQVACPLCEDGRIDKALMAPAIGAKGNRREVAPSDARAPAATPGSTPAPTPAMLKQVLQAMARAQARALESSEWVGTGFAGKARAMHDGDLPETAIHGQATLSEAKALVEEGVPIAPLLFPVVPPDAVN